jgi:PiT family inorganic phosphate transporter
VTIAWLVTMPVAALVAALAYWGASGPPGPYNMILMSLILAVLAGLLVVAVRRAPSAEDIEEQTEHEVPLRASSST